MIRNLFRPIAIGAVCGCVVMFLVTGSVWQFFPVALAILCSNAILNGMHKADKESGNESRSARR